MQVFINNARLSFPDLFRAKAFEEGSTPKFGCDLIVVPETQVLAVTADGTKKKTTMDKVLAAVAKEAWGDKGGKMLASLESKQKCLRDGDTRTNNDGDTYEGYEGCEYITAKNTRKPTVVDRDRTPLTEEDPRPYSGCFVNAKIDVYPNTKAKTRGIFAALMGVQFAKDGDALGGGGVASAEDFDELDDDFDDSDDSDDDLL